MAMNVSGRKKVGLVLGGGFARGIAHIGVLKVIKKHGIPVDYIAATSSGSIFGAGYAAGVDPDRIQEIMLMNASWIRLLRITFFRAGFISGRAIGGMILKYLGDLQFSDLKIPLSIVTTEILTGETMIINEGKLAPAVAASSAAPGMFAPHKWGDKYLVDGGLGDNLPVGLVRSMGADYVIAVDVVPSRPLSTLPGDPIRMYQRAFDILTHKLSMPQRKKADILIDPSIDETIAQFDLHKARRMVAEGEYAATRAVSRIKRELGL